MKIVFDEFDFEGRHITLYSAEAPQHMPLAPCYCLRKSVETWTKKGTTNLLSTRVGKHVARRAEDLRKLAIEHKKEILRGDVYKPKSKAIYRLITPIEKAIFKAAQGISFGFYSGASLLRNIERQGEKITDSQVCYLCRILYRHRTQIKSETLRMAIDRGQELGLNVTNDSTDKFEIWA